MRSINFTHSGGFPLTQDELDHLQQAYTECINALSSLGGDASLPAIISGMVKTTAGSTTTITPGWFLYNGAMIKFIGGTITPTGTDVVHMLIVNNTTTLTYNDGSTFPALSNVTAIIASGAPGITSTQFPFSIAQSYHHFFGLKGRETAWNSIAVSVPAASGGVSGTLYYKKNWLTNTLTIQATLTTSNAQNFSASPSAVNTLIATLPAEYFPTTNAYFTTYYYAANLFKDDLGVAWVKQMTSAVNVGGQVLINFLRPDALITAYTVAFNTIIPLD